MTTHVKPGREQVLMTGREGLLPRHVQYCIGNSIHGNSIQRCVPSELN
jgi:hypothetical protein